MGEGLGNWVVKTGMGLVRLDWTIRLSSPKQKQGQAITQTNTVVITKIILIIKILIKILKIKMNIK